MLWIHRLLDLSECVVAEVNNNPYNLVSHQFGYLLFIIISCYMLAKLCKLALIAMVLNKYNEPHCRLHLAQKDLKLAINLSESVDQPMHVGAAVNEVCVGNKVKPYSIQKLSLSSFNGYNDICIWKGCALLKLSKLMHECWLQSLNKLIMKTKVIIKLNVLIWKSCLSNKLRVKNLWILVLCDNQESN